MTMKTASENINDIAEYLKDGFFRYISEYKKRTVSTAKHYVDALNTISRRLVQLELVENSIYEVMELNQLLTIRERLNKDNYYNELNSRGNNMYSAGLNHYIDYVSGAGFSGDQNATSILDRPLPISKSQSQITNLWQRSSIMRGQVIEMANYQCEVNKDHLTFIAESNSKPYMEGHHIIPISKQPSFPNSLDNYANIICLCPICHRQLHYGIKREKMVLLDQIYEQRGDRLAQSGISMGKEEFVLYALASRDYGINKRIKTVRATAIKN